MSDTPGPVRRSRRSSGAVTLHDVARLAGVAPITASRALNTPERVSADVRQRVQDAVARTGYVPNRVAGGLASARSRLVAAVVPTIAGPLFGPTVQALDATLAAHGYQLMLGQSGYDAGREDALIEAIVARRPDGIVLTGIWHSPAGRRRLVASGIPIVETWDLTPTPIDMLVGFSHAAVGRAVAAFFHARGRRRLAVVHGDDERARRRLQAFREQAAELGLPPVQAVAVPAPTTLKSGREALVTLAALAAGAPGGAADAVFCTSDLLALGLLTEARVRGVAVPRELAVVGFGDLDFAADVEPALTTVRVHGAAIGERAARLLLARLEGHAPEARVLDLGFEIVERATT